MDIEKEVVDILKKNIKSHKNTFVLDAELFYDSVEFVHITLALETRFDFEFDEEDLFIDDFKTVEAFCCYVEKLIVQRV